MSAIEYVGHQILCGDSAQFQGDERDVMFLSMVDVPEGNGPLSIRSEEGHDDMYKKRFNVAASRARDQMWVIYSLDPDNDLKSNDIRRRLILHARDQHSRNRAVKEQERKVESIFEKQVFDRLVKAGYRVKTQWPVGSYRIDMVVEGNNKRLAVECDGDRWHTQEKLEEDMARQAILERLGWRFVRIRGSQFFRDPDTAMEPVFTRLRILDIPPIGMAATESDDSDGKDLKDRIIRRAAELRQQWLELGGQPSHRNVKDESYQQMLHRQSTLQFKAPLSPFPATGKNTLAPSSKLVGPQTVVIARSDNSSQSSTPVNLPVNPVVFLAKKGLKVIDKRASGGCLWVIGGKELEPIMNELRKMQITFTFTQNGSEVSKYQPAWYTKHSIF